VSETIADTGPILHLHEIGRLSALATVSPLILPPLVWAELKARSIGQPHFDLDHVEVALVPVAEPAWRVILDREDPPGLQPADAQVYALAADRSFQCLILTDDLALRRGLESRGAIVVGSVGLLVRAHASGKLTRAELESAFDSLFRDSTLHLSRAFRVYLRKLLDDLA
jgi:predicted nucleic acid-binding protein